MRGPRDRPARGPSRRYRESGAELCCCVQRDPRAVRQHDLSLLTGVRCIDFLLCGRGFVSKRTRTHTQGRGNLRVSLLAETMADQHFA